MGTRSLPIGFGIGQVGQWSSLFVSWLGRFAQEAVYIEPSFRDRLAKKAQRELGLSLSKEFPNQQLHGIEGVAEDILAYNRQVQRTIGQITTELADVLTSVIQLNEEADVESECLNALSSIAHDVDRREQLPEIRDRLKASIAMLETRFQERKRRQRDLVDNLQNRITVLEKLLDSPNRKQVGAEKRPSVRPAAGQNDPCTGLPARSDALSANDVLPPLRQASNMLPSSTFTG